ncbi:MAG: hypothetical protein ACRBM6_04765 [Geminicoccales bacterium]
MMDIRSEQLEALTKAGHINVDFLLHVNQVALHGAQTLVAGQSKALGSTFDEFGSLIQTLKQNDSRAFNADIQQHCMTTLLKCALGPMRVALECAQDMNRATFDKMKESLEVIAQPSEPPASKKG